MLKRVSRLDMWIIKGGVILLLIGLLSSCGILKKSPVVLEEITYFYYSNSGSERYSNETYEAERKGDHVELTIVLPGADTEYNFIESVDFMKKLTDIANRSNMGNWNGFDKRDKNGMDGSSFKIELITQDDKEVSASGYMKYPDNYGTARSEIKELFMSVYDKAE